jgi:hypothetical protein
MTKSASPRSLRRVTYSFTHASERGLPASVLRSCQYFSTGCISRPGGLVERLRLSRCGSSATKQRPNSAIGADTNTRRVQIGGCPRLPIRAWLNTNVRLRSFWQAVYDLPRLLRKQVAAALLSALLRRRFTQHCSEFSDVLSKTTQHLALVRTLTLSYVEFLDLEQRWQHSVLLTLR